MDTKVRDVMTPGPIGVDYYQSIGEAARTMRDWGVGAVLVVNDQALYGLVTDRDLVVRAVAEARGPDEAVGPLSTGDLIGVDVDADTSEAAPPVGRGARCPPAARHRERTGRGHGVAGRPGHARPGHARPGLGPGRRRGRACQPLTRSPRAGSRCRSLTTQAHRGKYPLIRAVVCAPRQRVAAGGTGGDRDEKTARHHVARASVPGSHRDRPGGGP